MRSFLIATARFLSRHPAFAVAFALIYFIFPWDFLPEAFTGLAGYADDLIVWVALFWLLKFFRKKNADRADPNIIETTAEIKRNDPPK